VTMPLVTAAGGARWESSLLAELAGSGSPLSVVRRCVDVAELVAVAATGQAVVAVVDARLRHLDVDVVDRLATAGVAAIGVIAAAGSEADVELLRSVGISFAVPSDASAEVFTDVARTAAAALSGNSGGAGRGFADPAGAVANHALFPPSESDLASRTAEGLASGTVIAVWGPAGSPGRTTVATYLADEIARCGASCLLIDADVYGGVVANQLGLLDDSAGLVAACRQAQSDRLGLVGLAALCWQLNERLRVLTGLNRADRWPELRPAAVEAVLATARQLCEYIVVDVGFCLETDEELSFDTVAPRRNGATLSVLESADVVLAVGAADPIGLQRLVRGLEDLRTAEVSAPIRVLVNKVRAGSIPGTTEVELDAALRRFAGRAPSAMIPYDRDGLDRALVAGKCLSELSPSSPLRRALVDLARSITGRTVPTRGHRRRTG
jgi:Flp pilus assembly CpaE family ATPase